MATRFQFTVVFLIALAAGQRKSCAAAAPQARTAPDRNILRERVRLLGGTLKTESARGKGTRLCVEIPLQK